MHRHAQSKRFSDITANTMLSRPSDYEGGGTYFSDIDQTVRLKFGELLVGRSDYW